MSEQPDFTAAVAQAKKLSSQFGALLLVADKLGDVAGLQQTAAETQTRLDKLRKDEETFLAQQAEKAAAIHAKAVDEIAHKHATVDAYVKEKKAEAEAILATAQVNADAHVKAAERKLEQLERAKISHEEAIKAHIETSNNLKAEIASWRDQLLAVRADIAHAQKTYDELRKVLGDMHTRMAPHGHVGTGFAP